MSRMSRPASGGRQSSSEEEGDEDEDESNTTELYQDRERVSDASLAVETTPGHGFVRGNGRSEDESSSQAKYLYLQNMPRKGTQYINWPQQALRRVCSHHKIKNMSRCKTMPGWRRCWSGWIPRKKEQQYLNDCGKWEEPKGIPHFMRAHGM